MLHDLRNSVGRASRVPAIVDDAFEKGCLWLIIESFKRLKNTCNFNLIEWHEPFYSALMIAEMEKIRDEVDIAFQIDPECYQHYIEIIEKGLNPNKAPGIDIRIKGGWVQRDIHYAVEAKILVENDWRTRRSSYLCGRYINTGIDNFVEGRYSPIIPKGCLVGYVIQGSALNIKNKINALMILRERENEKLSNRHIINGCQDCFHSKHIRESDGKKLMLRHIFLTFC